MSNNDETKDVCLRNKLQTEINNSSTPPSPRLTSMLHAVMSWAGSHDSVDMRTTLSSTVTLTLLLWLGALPDVNHFTV